MATYVYAIVPREHPLPETAHGVAGPESKLRKVTGDGVAAVVGDAPDDLRARRRHLAAHHEVLTELAEQGPSLPLRFGFVVSDDDEVGDHLSAYSATYRDSLAHLSGRTELNVKAAVSLDEVLGDIVRADPDLMALRERARAGGAYEDQLRLGEAVARAVDRYEGEIAERIANVLRPYAVEVREGPRVEGSAANLSFLVPVGEVDTFRDAVRGLEGDMGAGVELRCTGPLPAYSFADTRVAPGPEED